MKKILLPFAISIAVVSCSNDKQLASPDGGISISMGHDGTLYIASALAQTPQEIKLGLTTNQRNFADSLRLVSTSDAIPVTADYTMIAGKRAHCVNFANQRDYFFVNPDKDTLKVEVRAYNDGVTFRYVIDAQQGESICDDATTYIIPDGQKRWLQSYHADSYEDFYPLATDGKSTDPRGGQTWAYPALTQIADSTFVLITEAGIERGHAASYLDNSANTQAYTLRLGSPMHADGTWASPWRLAIMGSLADIVESTLVTDVSPEAVVAPQSWIAPAPAAWVYWAYNHGSNDYQIVKQYVDLAAQMGWPYVLIDAEWDEMGNGGNIEDALAYAHSKGVKPMIWYNSSVGWVNGAPTPKFRLNKPADRKAEMQWMQDHGVAGIKVDFFNGDAAETMDYYLDILEDALDHNLLVTFHGATVPRGWQRTYPNLMTVEGVYGAEWYNNLPVLTNRAAAHNATLPFTRNVIGPMDYTPGTFTDSQHPHITTHGHELALSFLFESALQHMPDRPEAYLTLPDDVKSLLSNLPTAWDDTRYITGYPGECAVVAREKDGVWYIAGINGSDQPRDIVIDLGKHGINASSGIIYADGDTDRSFAPAKEIDLTGTIAIPTKARGGWVIVLKQAS